MLERSRRVVLLIDYDNLQICASRDTPGRDLQLVPVVQLAQRYGTVVVARAYAEWNLSTERLAVYKAGIEPAFAPVLRTESDRSGKSLADTVMVAEGMDMLWTLSPDVVVLATSDKDLIPLVRVAKQRGAFVVVLGSDFTAIPLREMADEHVTYKQLITDASGRYTTEAGPARQPAALPEPARRRSRERNGRESRAAAASATSGSGGSPAPSQSQAAPARAERETPAAAAGAGAAPSTPEPVAPVTAASPGETDGQIGSRRRRRRGSRRRSERVAGAGEGTPTGEYADVSDSAAPEASDAEVAEASSGTVEAPLSAFDAGVAPPPSEPSVPATAAEREATADEAAPEATAATSAEAPAPAAPRERRRRTRRPAAGADTIAASAEAAAASAPPSEAAAAIEPTITPTTPAPPGDAVAEANGSPEAANGESAEPPAAAPARRARRVASAARGRLR